jgi:hypothetical protein
LVDHGVEGIGEPLEVGVGGLEVEPGVEVAPCDGAGGAGDNGQWAQRARAGEAAERNPEDGRDDPGDNEGEGEVTALRSWWGMAAAVTDSDEMYVLEPWKSTECALVPASMLLSRPT